MRRRKNICSPAVEGDPNNVENVYPLALSYLTATPPDDVNGLFFIARSWLPTSTTTAISTWSRQPRAATALSVLLGNGDGTFRPPIHTATLPGLHGGGGGRLQRRRQHGPRVHLRRTKRRLGFRRGAAGRRAGRLRGPAPVPGSHPEPRRLAVADLNADGRPDVVTANASTVSVLLGNGDGTLSYNFGSSNFASGPDPRATWRSATSPATASPTWSPPRSAEYGGR